MALGRRVLTAFLVAATTGALLPGAAAARDRIRIEVLSNRADLVSGGDALLRVSGAVARPHLAVDGRDVTDEFAAQPDGSFTGVVDGLRDGPNVFSARADAGAEARIVLTDHPIGGPVFAGAQVQPWLCGTVAAGLGEPTDAQCDAPTTFTYVYRSALTGTFLPYSPQFPPASALVARTVTDEGVTVPYVVREETGTMDRGIYRLAVLYDSALGRAPAWNHKFVATFAGGAAGHHSQDAPPDVLDHTALSRGFMVGTSGLFVHQSNVDQVVSAEALMMLKEHVVERYGRIRYTIGNGCSGGSIQQQMIAAMYPGLLNGIQPACSFPDLWSTATEFADCHLLNTYFAAHALQWLDSRQRAAVDGHQSAANCGAWDASFGGLLKPDEPANCNLPPGQVYQPATDPGGVRCTVQDYQQAIWGPRAQDGFAKRPFDNVGVQYGLDAVNAGTISPARFVDLNAHIGGMDIDWRPQASRSELGPGTADIAYRTGQITDARRLATVPIIDLRGYIEFEVHTSFHSYQIRAKLDRDTGGHANQLIWTMPFLDQALAGVPGSIAEQSFLLIDQWLGAIERDPRQLSPATKVGDDKPATATDRCWIGGAPETDPTRCATTYPHYGDSRIAAGAPASDDVLKCVLKPLSRNDYRIRFTDAQWAQLQQSFPGGVCDPAKPGVAQRASTPWTTFAHGPGGQPLGPAPTSTG